MAEELLSLKWNNHQAHFVDILTLLREKDMFIDATIACGGKVYSAHKFVLSTCSDYFKQIFTRSPNSNPIVFMKDVSCRDIEALLDFMYNGEVSVPQSSLGSLIKTAEGLQIKGLAVPDDPPSSRRQQERDKREREPSLSFPENRSPPPKRRVREKNTPPRRLSNHQQQSRPSNSTTDNTSLEINPLQNNDSSENSSLVRNNSPGAGPESSDSSSKKQHNNINANSRKHSTADEEGDEDRGGGGDDSNHDDDAADNGALQQQPQHDGHEGSLGTAAITHSKQEEMEIKQEDVVDLGEDDDGGDWGDGGGMGDGGADDGGVGGADSLSSADNTVNFSDVLLAHSEGGAMAGGSGAAGDSAMEMLLQGVSARRVARIFCNSDIVCPLCSKSFSCPESMIRHCQGHLPSTYRLHCSDCGKSFHRRDQFNYHKSRCSAQQAASSSAGAFVSGPGTAPDVGLGVSLASGVGGLSSLGHGDVGVHPGIVPAVPGTSSHAVPTCSAPGAAAQLPMVILGLPAASQSLYLVPSNATLQGATPPTHPDLK